MIPSQVLPTSQGLSFWEICLGVHLKLVGAVAARRDGRLGRWPAGVLRFALRSDLPAGARAGRQPDYTYIIGAGDNVNIIVWRNPELSMSVPVRPDGKIAAPLVDELVAQGKTPVQLARDIEQVLSKYVRDPVVTVLVTGFVGPYSEQIRVVGEAAGRSSCPTRAR
jgi:polysaccharide export outer membrane protein